MKMSTSSASRPAPSHDDIARLAYRLWQKQGCPAGHDLEFWVQAEKVLAQATAAQKRRRTRCDAAKQAAELEERVESLLAEFGAPEQRSATAL